MSVHWTDPRIDGYDTVAPHPGVITRTYGDKVMPVWYVNDRAVNRGPWHNNGDGTWSCNASVPVKVVRGIVKNVEQP